MKKRTFLGILMMLLSAASFACGPYCGFEPHSELQIALYRVAGKMGVEKFIETNEANLNHEDAAIADAWHATLDKIAGQKDAYYSRMFWHTDLDEAKALARETDKPILYLRMLGDLREDMSCANSRMFRTLLYTNSDVQNVMNDYVLCWGSERPVPQVTIDFGDGRVLKTTVTGNSIHYILDSNGQPIDAIPGLNSPVYFVDHLNDAYELHEQLLDQENEQKSESIRAYHQEKATATETWAGMNMIQVGAVPAFNPLIELAAAQWRTVSKSGYELPMISALNPWTSTAGNAIDLDKGRWYEVAANMKYAPTLQENTKELIRSKNPERYAVKETWDALVANLQMNLAVETARNHASMKYMLHQWFTEGAHDLEALNSRVYNELFVTPQEDPWLGLMSDEIYSGLDLDGIGSLD